MYIVPNARTTISFTEEGINICVNDLQKVKQNLLIIVTEDGIVIFDNEWQS